MNKCYFCEKESREYFSGYWCESCRKIKNIGNVYGFERIMNILNKCCIRDENQLECKIKNHKITGIDDKDYTNPKTVKFLRNKD